MSETEIAAAFSGDLGTKFGPILDTAQVCVLLGISKSTLYQWKAEGRFVGAVRKRGKHIRFWRDRVIDIYFNGPTWERITNIEVQQGEN